MEETKEDSSYDNSKESEAFEEESTVLVEGKKDKEDTVDASSQVVLHVDAAVTNKTDGKIDFKVLSSSVGYHSLLISGLYVTRITGKTSREREDCDDEKEASAGIQVNLHDAFLHAYVSTGVHLADLLEE